MCIRDSLPVTLVYHDPVLLPGIVEPLKDPLGALTFIAFRQPPYKLSQLLGRDEILRSQRFVRHEEGGLSRTFTREGFTEELRVGRPSAQVMRSVESMQGFALEVVH